MKRTQLTVVLVALSLILAACGADEGDSTTTTAVETTTTTLAATTTTAAPETTTTTEADTTTTVAEAGIVPGEDPDVDAIVEVYAVVFDSTTTFEEKAQYIDDPSGLEETVATYAETGESVGGVSAEVTAVTVAGEQAEVVYTLLFSGNPTYPGLDGTAIKVDDSWKVSREMFCGVMASARSSCPTD